MEIKRRQSYKTVELEIVLDNAKTVRRMRSDKRPPDLVASNK